jgi:hypothetical protein
MIEKLTLKEKIFIEVYKTYPADTRQRELWVLANYYDSDYIDVNDFFSYLDGIRRYGTDIRKRGRERFYCILQENKRLADCISIVDTKHRIELCKSLGWQKLMTDAIAELELQEKNLRDNTISIELFDENKVTLKTTPLKRLPINNRTRYEVMHRAGFKCQCCGAKPNDDNDVTLEVDHIVPVSKGGSDFFDNLQVLCKKCNLGKHNNFAYDHNKDIDLWQI